MDGAYRLDDRPDRGSREPRNRRLRRQWCIPHDRGSATCAGLGGI